jgi:hypothetical protein
VKVLFEPAEDTTAAWHKSEAAAVDGLEREVKQMAMETWLREVNLAHHTAPLLALGLCNVEDLSDPVLAPDEVLLGAGLSSAEVTTADPRNISVGVLYFMNFLGLSCQNVFAVLTESEKWRGVGLCA